MFQNCKKVKAEHLMSSGFLPEIQSPIKKCEDINIDFIVCLPRTQKSYNSILVVVDRIINCTLFFPIKSTYLMEDYARTS